MQRVYGPYLRKDGRKHIVIVEYDDDGKEKSRRTQSYPRYLIETHTGEKIPEGIEVDHGNRDFNDNDLSNFFLVEKRFHASIDSLRREIVEAPCAHCGKYFIPTRNQVSARARAKPGPFCSKSCARRGAKCDIQRPAPSYYRAGK